MPLPVTVSCFSKIQIGSTFLVPAHPCSPRQWAVKRVYVLRESDTIGRICPSVHLSLFYLLSELTFDLEFLFVYGSWPYIVAYDGLKVAIIASYVRIQVRAKVELER